ncbi:hypothetical protein ACWDUL_33805 [Nocardia niigatensis]
MISVGDLVRTVKGGVHLFRVTEIHDEGVDADKVMATIESVDPAPGAYPFTVLRRFLVAES